MPLQNALAAQQSLQIVSMGERSFFRRRLFCSPAYRSEGLSNAQTTGQPGNPTFEYRHYWREAGQEEAHLHWLHNEIEVRLDL